jgi:chemotaxis protein MotB
MMHRRWKTVTPLLLAVGAAWLLSGCVTKSAYNSMLQQQQTLESALRSEIAANQVKIEQLENGIRVRMSNDLLYQSGSADLHPKGREALDKVAGQLATMASQGNQVDVVGNTDNVPVGRELERRYPTNWELAGARAAIVVRYLQEKGVNPVQLEAISAAQYHPVASNDTAAGQAENRRTDLLLRPTR